MDRMSIIADGSTQSPPSYDPPSTPASSGSAKTPSDYGFPQHYKSVQQHQGQGARAKSKYGSVDVLLVQWAEDDLGVSSEVRRLEGLLAGTFNFTTHLFPIPSVDSESQLARRLMDFREGKGAGDLLIVYYAGHAGGSEQRCVWAANMKENSPELRWHNIQGLVLGWPADTLIILDCCYSLLALSPHSGEGDNWFLGSSAKESVAAGVRWNSFTSIMISQLKRRANIYFDQGRPFSVQDIDFDMSSWDRGDLYCSPFAKRLTEHQCKPTDLTPLPLYRGPSRVQTLHSEHGLEASQHDVSSLTIRPRPDYATLPPSIRPVANTNTWAPTNDLQRNGHPIALMPGDVQTIRLTGLPPLANKSDITNWFEHRLARKNIISNVGSLHQSPSTTATITFTSVAVAKRALNIQDRRFQSSAGGGEVWIAMDKDFHGLTTLHSSERSPDGRPNVDLVLVHGAGGHPINSFACHFAEPSKEVMWPRDELPQALEANGIYPRILTVGWDAHTWLTPETNTQSPSEVLVKAIRAIREPDPKRRLVFFAHDVGGFLVKQSINSIINEGLGDRNFYNPITYSFFAGTPHHEVGDDGFASMLTAMRSLPPFNDPTDTAMRLLKRHNRTISNLSSEFDAIREGYNIKTFSFFESGTTNDRPIIPQASAILDSTPGRSLAIETSHSHLTKLSGARSNAEIVINIIRNALKTDTVHTIQSRTPNVEQVYAKLRRYDTVFLVDDSGSMYGTRWRIAAKVLANIATIAVKYDKDGVDIRFFNELLEDGWGRNLDSTAKVMELFDQVDPDGPTPTADILEEELNNYMFEYRRNRHRKGLNLIVLTDGEPEEGQDVEGVIVKYANALKKIEAPRYQVGIQIVQIGGDLEAARFLKTLDDDLVQRHGLDRDMVDTVPWHDADEDRLSEKILLGGILQRFDNLNLGSGEPTPRYGSSPRQKATTESDSAGSVLRKGQKRMGATKFEETLPHLLVSSSTSSDLVEVASLPTIMPPSNVDISIEDSIKDPESLHDDRLLRPQKYMAQMRQIEAEVVCNSALPMFRVSADSLETQIYLYRPSSDFEVQIRHPRCSCGSHPSYDDTFKSYSARERGPSSLAPTRTMFWGALRDLIECRNLVHLVMHNVEHLQNTKVCGDSINYFVCSSDRDGVIELVSLEKDAIISIASNFDCSLNKLAVMLLEGNDEQSLFTNLDDCLVAYEIIRQGLKIEISPSVQQAHKFKRLTATWRTIAHGLDLAVISYCGAHLQDFDAEYLGGRLDRVGVFPERATWVVSDAYALMHRVSLTCLNDFLGGETVWAFGQGSASEYCVSTTMESFADIWGPVWKSTLQDQPELTLSFQAGLGKIVSLNTNKNQANSTQEQKYEGTDHLPDGTGLRPVLAGELKSHWLANDSEDQLRPEPFHHVPFQRFLIGTVLTARLEPNQGCLNSMQSTLSRLRKENSLKHVDTEEPSTYRDSETFQVSVSSFGLGVGRQRQYKRRTGVTWKQDLISAWHNKPGERRPEVLESWAGVEVSACTGNARRRRLVSLLGCSTVRTYLDNCNYDWGSDGCKEAYLTAISGRDPRALYLLYREKKDWREHIGRAICMCLCKLSRTGIDEHGNLLALASFQRLPERLACFYQCEHTWTGMLADTSEAGTMAVLIDTCLCLNHGHFRDYSAFGLSNHEGLGFTVLETALEVSTAAPMPPNLFKKYDPAICPSQENRWRVRDLQANDKFGLGRIGNLRVVRPIPRGQLLVHWRAHGIFEFEEVRNFIRKEVCNTYERPYHRELFEDFGAEMRPIPIHVISEHRIEP